MEDQSGGHKKEKKHKRNEDLRINSPYFLYKSSSFNERVGPKERNYKKEGPTESSFERK
jgi:hypothetical protein